MGTDLKMCVSFLPLVAISTVLSSNRNSWSRPFYL